MQRDPLGINPAGDAVNSFNPTRQYEDGMNGYEYGQSNPVLNRDLWGLASEVPRQVCCKIKRKEIVPVVNYYTNTVWPGIRTICTQETISSRGAGPGVACQCHYKNLRDIKVYGWYSGNCCWCTVSLKTAPIPIAGHYFLQIDCDGDGEHSWISDTYPRDKDVGLEPYPATGDSMGYPEWSWWTLASFQTSCDNASVLKSVLNKSSWDFSISICSGDGNCFQYALPMFISLAGMCP